MLFATLLNVHGNQLHCILTGTIEQLLSDFDTLLMYMMYHYKHTSSSVVERRGVYVRQKSVR